VAWNYLAPKRRRKEVGDIGEVLALECLAKNGFTNIHDMNDEFHRTFPYADVMAEQNGTRYFISVKSRNEEKKGGGINPSYNLLKISNSRKSALEREGHSKEQITKMLINEANILAERFEAVAAWITVPIRPARHLYSAYFGLLKDLGVRRSIPMKPDEYQNYVQLADWTRDDRIGAGLTNR